MVRQDIDKMALDAVMKFASIKEAFTSASVELEKQKKYFYEVMEEYCLKNKCSSATFSGEPYNKDGKSKLVVKRVDKSYIEWDAEKLEKKVDKAIAKQVIKKQYRVLDMQGLTRYLRSCGVDPAIFKQFIQVDRMVDEKAVDRLGDTGHLEVSQIAGCYTIKSQKPYFTIQVKEDEA